METVLITGGSGIIGSRLSEILSMNGFAVRHLSRNPSGKEKYATYQWDLAKGYIDNNALKGVDHIIHLAGANVAESRWTRSRKKEIIDSRVNSLQLIFHKVTSEQIPIKSLVSASGSNYYGFDENSRVFKETDPPGKDFLAQVCIKWEAAALQFEPICKVSILRTGVVLSPKGGALEELSKPIKLFIGAPLGSGNQWMPWIHLDDVCMMYMLLIKTGNAGIYNAVAPEDHTNREFTQMVAKAIHKPLWLPPIPSFVMKMLLGEMSEILLNGNRISCEKITRSGYVFRHPSLHESLQNLLS